MKDTERGKHDGGDAAWEEKKLGSYKTSEVRLTEIQENLCKEVKRGQDQCHTLANEHEELVEDWWFKNQDTSDLHTWLCIEKLTVCCPDGHFGPNCDACSDCNGNGKCKGNGTRKGNGKCSCDAGYTGESCDNCSIQYYESFRDDTKLLCSPCHASCGGDGGCTVSGPKGCRKCKEGWRMHPEHGCFDINECVEESRICKQKQFCVNKEGSYSCLDCDRSCESCDGDGPDMCKKCAEGFELREGKCTGEFYCSFCCLRSGSGAWLSSFYVRVLLFVCSLLWFSEFDPLLVKTQLVLSLKNIFRDPRYRFSSTVDRLPKGGDTSKDIKFLYFLASFT